MKLRLVFFVMVLALSALVVPVMGQDFPGAGNTCTTDPKDGSGLPECGTPDDNECNPGGVLYREENQDGCPNLWYWKAGWFLARFRDGKISRADFPKEFESVLPPLPKVEPEAIHCYLDMTSQGYSIIPVSNDILNPTGAWWDDGIHTDVELTSGGYTWGWHNGPSQYDLGFDFQEWNGPDYHVYTTGSGWWYPTIGDCTVNESGLPAS